MKRRYTPTERIGINAVERIVLDELGWMFHPQTTVDVGIDAHIEIVDPEPTGKLIALQIKTGSSHFRERADAFLYYGTLTHVDYWLGHSLPVILVAHFPASGETLWSPVLETTVARTGKRWRIEIPKTSVFGLKTRDSLVRLTRDVPGQRRSVKDFLTNLYNRSGFHERLRTEIERAFREQRPLSLVLIDVDHFKTVNDQHGHMLGDEVLRQIATRLQSSVTQPRSTVARYGGDEFAIVLPNTALVEAQSVAEQIRINVGSTTFASGTVQVALTLSLGVAALGPEMAVEETRADSLLEAAADMAMYQAKEDGRNCVRTHLPG